MSKYIRVGTPRGVAIFPWVTLGKPDVKFQADGLYHMTMRIPDDQMGTFKEALVDAFVKNVMEALKGSQVPNFVVNGDLADGLQLPWKEAYDNKADESGVKQKVAVPGFTDVHMSTKAIIRFKDGRAPIANGLDIQDAKGNDLSGRVDLDGEGKLKVVTAPKVSIGGGSLVRAVVSPFAWGPNKNGKGMSLRLHGIRVISLKTYTGAMDILGQEDDVAGDDAFVYGEEPEVQATPATGDVLGV